MIDEAFKQVISENIDPFMYQVKHVCLYPPGLTLLTISVGVLADASSLFCSDSLSIKKHNQDELELGHVAVITSLGLPKAKNPGLRRFNL